jgi:ankyrin repeat protein
LHAALAQAAGGGNFDAFRSLARRGALAGLTRAETTQLLRRAAEQGNARLVAVALRLNPEVNRIDPENSNLPILADASNVRCRWNQQSADCDPALVVLLLLRAGANPRLVDRSSPTSPLSFVSDVRVARMLLAAGADPNFANYEGAPPIFLTYHEDVALALLDAGANPRARRPADGMNVAGWSRDQQWPRVLERLRAQGIRP